MKTIDIRPLGATVRAEVCGVDVDRLAGDATLATILVDALEAHGALVFRDLHISPEQQVAFCRHIGEVDCSSSNHDVEGIYRISLDPRTNRTAAYLRGTFVWHVDGCTPTGDEWPQMATVLSAKAVPARGGETEFANSYAAYADLTEEEESRLHTLRVVHSLEASQRRVNPDPTEKQLAAWRSQPEHEHPLVWTHRSGRHSLLIGASADHIVGMSLDEGRALLDELLERATTPDRVYRHEWTVGDTVIWDNRGVLHRAAPYDADSGREMLRHHPRRRTDPVRSVESCPAFPGRPRARGPSTTRSSAPIRSPMTTRSRPSSTTSSATRSSSGRG
jgi:alpha-ketoglutarate-dependent taurine dioxygenase